MFVVKLCVARMYGSFLDTASMTGAGHMSQQYISVSSLYLGAGLLMHVRGGYISWAVR